MSVLEALLVSIVTSVTSNLRDVDALDPEDDTDSFFHLSARMNGCGLSFTVFLAIEQIFVPPLLACSKENIQGAPCYYDTDRISVPVI